MYFELAGEVEEIEVIAEGRGIRALAALEKRYGKGRWRKVKGQAMIRLRDGKVVRAELHWFEAHGIGRRKMKIKRFLE